MTAPAAEVSEETTTRCLAILSIAHMAQAFSLPLPAEIDVWVTEPDAAAEVTIRAYAEKLDGRVLYRVIDDDVRFGIEVNVGGAVYRVIHVRDAVVRRTAGQMAAQTEGAAA